MIKVKCQNLKRSAHFQVKIQFYISKSSEWGLLNPTAFAQKNQMSHNSHLLMQIFPRECTVHECHTNTHTEPHQDAACCRSYCAFPCRPGLIFLTAVHSGEIAALGLSDVSQRHVYPEALVACSLNTGLRARLTLALHAAGHQTSLVHDEPLTIPLLTSVIVL